MRDLRTAVIVLLLVAFSSRTRAEDARQKGPGDQESPPDLFSEKTPDSPAFVALGISPTDIQRPTTPKAFATALATKFQSQGGTATVPQGLAIEVAPYWLTQHPTLTFEQYAESGPRWSWLRNFTVSVATSGTTAKTSNTVAAGTDLSAGLRTTLFHPKLSADQRKCVDEIHNALNTTAKATNEELVAELDKRLAIWWRSNHGDEPIPTKPEEPPVEPTAVSLPVLPKPVDPADPKFADAIRAYQAAYLRYQVELQAYDRYQVAYREFREKSTANEHNTKNFQEYRQKKKELFKVVADELNPRARQAQLAALDKQVEPCMKVINARGVGFSWDLAGAVAESFPTGQFQDRTLRRVLAWTTFSYSTASVSFLGLARYVGERATAKDDFVHGLDLGVRLVYARERWGLSGEAIHRSLDGQGQQRYSAGLDYRLVDDSWINVTFGKDYGGGGDGALIALTNLQVNLGKKRIAPLGAQPKEPSAAP